MHKIEKKTFRQSINERLVDDFNSDLLSDFRQLLTNRMKLKKSYRSGLEIFEAFRKCHLIYEDFMTFQDADSYNNFIDAMFSILKLGD